MLTRDKLPVNYHLISKISIYLFIYLLIFLSVSRWPRWKISLLGFNLSREEYRMAKRPKRCHNKIRIIVRIEGCKFNGEGRLFFTLIFHISVLDEKIFILALNYGLMKCIHIKRFNERSKAPFQPKFKFSFKTNLAFKSDSWLLNDKSH